MGMGTVKSWDSENSIGGMTPAERHGCFVPGIRRPQNAVEAFWKLAGRRPARQQDTRPWSAGCRSRGARSKPRTRPPPIGHHVRTQALYTDAYSSHRW